MAIIIQSVFIGCILPQNNLKMKRLALNKDNNFYKGFTATLSKVLVLVVVVIPIFPSV